jgi:hypothetical protein
MAAAPKPPTSPPPVQAQSDAEGNRVYDWGDGAHIVCSLSRRQRSGKYPVVVHYKSDLINSTVVDMDNLSDRERLTAHCQALDGAVAWLPRFVQIADDLRTHSGPTRTMAVVQLSRVAPARVDFLWKPFLPRGRPVAIEGDPGVGKSALVLKIAAHLSSGTAFPTLLDGVPLERDFPPQSVCLLTSEDDPADTLVPRLVVNGGDPARVHLITGWTQPDGEKGPVTMQDLDLLQQALEAYHPALLVFDPVQSFFGRGIDMNHANDTRPVLDAVAGLCKQYGCTPLYVRHIGKASREKALHAGLGSIDIIGNMRSALYLGKDPDNDERRILAHSKSNNARLGPSLAYVITTVQHDMYTDDGDVVTVEAPRLDWDGRSELSADDLNAPPLSGDGEEDRSALEQAQEFLQDALSVGPLLYEDLTKAMKKAGIALRTIHRAKVLVGVKSRRRVVDGVAWKDQLWEWFIPPVC